MHTDLQNQLLEKHAPLFEWEGQKSGALMFGIETDDGWFDLIDQTLINVTEQAYQENQPLPAIIQIKEKLGELRIYGKPLTTNMHHFIQQAEEQSSTICEVCGKEGQIRQTSNGLIKTVCDDHDIF